MENENSIRKAAREAVEYWIEQLDFNARVKEDKRINDSIEMVVRFYTVTQPEWIEQLRKTNPDLKQLFLKKLKLHAPTKSKLEKFKVALTREIVKDVSDPTRQCCYLYTEKDRAAGKLAIIASQCGIETDDKSLFKKNIEMFVTPGKVELRYDPNAKGLVTYYDEKQASVGRSKKQ